MELTQAHLERVAHLLPKQRGNVSLSNLTVLNAILYMAEQGSAWRDLPTSFGKWHTIYTRTSRWAKTGVLERIMTELQRLDIIPAQVKTLVLDNMKARTIHMELTAPEKKTDHAGPPRPTATAPPLAIDTTANTTANGTMKAKNNLHLPSLSISGFRGIGQLEIPRLARATLIVGRNTVGKTTVLDAARLYAARGSLSAMNALLLKHDERRSVRNEDGEAVSLPDYDKLFHHRNASTTPSFSRCGIGPIGGDYEIPDGLTIMRLDKETMKIIYDEHERYQRLPPEATPPRHGRQMVSQRTPTSTKPAKLEDEQWPPPIQYESLGPGRSLDEEIARRWDNIAGTDDEERLVDALQLLFDDLSDEKIKRIAVRDGNPRNPKRRAIVRLSNRPTPVALKSLGDGAVRLLDITLALANSRDGLLTIDEVESSIHFTALEDLWHMILRTAQETNVQILATTHSWDCVKGFARAVGKLDDVEGLLVRLERDNDQLHAIEYSGEELEIAADQGIETR